MKAIKTLPQSAASLAKELSLDPSDPPSLACAGEFLLEGLYPVPVPMRRIEVL